MTDYNVINATETDPSAPLKSSLFKRLAANPIAIAETSLGAPVVRAGWYPYNMSAYGDGTTGLVYNSAIDGSVGSITLPDFADGYEYRIIGDELTLSSGSIQIDLYRETSAAYAGYQVFATSPGASNVGVLDLIISPRAVRNAHTLQGVAGPQGTGNSSTSGTAAVAISWHHTTAQKILRARIRNGVVNISAGKVWLYVRRLP